jgi:hypothetical protein
MPKIFVDRFQYSDILKELLGSGDLLYARL